ncbi:hypothetical protein BSL78_13228, partial [Apostichopus japonicus]
GKLQRTFLCLSKLLPSRRRIHQDHPSKRLLARKRRLVPMFKDLLGPQGLHQQPQILRIKLPTTWKQTQATLHNTEATKENENDIRKKKDRFQNSDRGGRTWRQTLRYEPMAPDCAGEATLALLDVVENIASAGTPPKVPEEWLNCTPPLACSAICEAKFQRLEDKFDVRMGQMELLLHQQEEQLQKQEREINSLREQLSERETSFQPPIHQPAEVYSTPSVSEAIGGALEALNNQDRSITQLLSSPSDVGVSPNFQFEKMLIECDQDRSIMARKLMAHFFSVDEMVNGNTSGKGSKQQLDVSRLSEIRRLIFS